MQKLGCLKFESPVSCPGRDAALFALLRRTGTVPDAGASYGPGSAAHRSAKSYALRCVRATERRKIAANEGINTASLRTPPNMELAVIAKLIVQTLLYIAGMGALLFIAAGTWRWPAAWVFLAAMAILDLAAACGWPGPIRRCSPSGCAR